MEIDFDDQGRTESIHVEWGDATGNASAVIQRYTEALALVAEAVAKGALKGAVP